MRLGQATSTAVGTGGRSPPDELRAVLSRPPAPHSRLRPPVPLAVAYRRGPSTRVHPGCRGGSVSSFRGLAAADCRRRRALDLPVWCAASRRRSKSATACRAAVNWARAASSARASALAVEYRPGNRSASPSRSLIPVIIVPRRRQRTKPRRPADRSEPGSTSSTTTVAGTAGAAVSVPSSSSIKINSGSLRHDGPGSTQFEGIDTTHPSLWRTDGSVAPTGIPAVQTTVNSRNGRQQTAETHAATVPSRRLRARRCPPASTPEGGSCCQGSPGCAEVPWAAPPSWVAHRGVAPSKRPWGEPPSRAAPCQDGRGDPCLQYRCVPGDAIRTIKRAAAPSIWTRFYE